MKMSWSELIPMYWDKCYWLRSDDEVFVAAEEIKNRFPNNPPDNEELVQVIRWMASAEGKQTKCPTLRELIRAICICRKIRREQEMERIGNTPANNQDAQENEIKQAMRYARNRVEAWDALCSMPLNDENRRFAIEEWAMHAIGFERPTMEEMEVPRWQDVLAKCRGGARRVTDEIKSKKANDCLRRES